MSTENLIQTYNTLQHPLRDITSNLHNLFVNKLQCIICNASIDVNSKEHQCVLRPQHKDIIIRHKYL